MGVPVTRINKLGEGSPHVLDLIRKRRCDLVINTPTGSGARTDGYEIRSAAVRHGIPCVTTMTGATAAARAIAAGKEDGAPVRSLQEIHGRRQAPPPLLSRGRKGATDGSGAASAAGSARSSGESRPPAATGSSPCSTARARSPSPASSTCSPRPSTGSRDGGRPVPAAGDLGRRDRPSRRGDQARLPARGRRPGHRPALRAGGGGAGLATGPLGNAFSTPREVSPGAAGAILVGGGIGIAPLA